MRIHLFGPRNRRISRLSLPMAIAALLGACSGTSSARPTEMPLASAGFSASPGSPAFCAQLADSRVLQTLSSSLPRILSGEASPDDPNTVIEASRALQEISQSSTASVSVRTALQQSSTVLKSWADAGLTSTKYDDIAVAFEKLDAATQETCRFSLT